MAVHEDGLGVVLSMARQKIRLLLELFYYCWHHSILVVCNIGFLLEQLIQFLQELIRGSC